MNKLYRNIIVALAVILLLVGIWYFSWLVAYFFIAGVLSIVGRPLVELFFRIKYKKFQFPKWLAALITLVMFWLLFIGFIKVFTPLILNQVNEISEVDWNQFRVKMDEPIKHLEGIYQDYFAKENEKLEDIIVEKASGYFNLKNISTLFDSVSGFLGSILLAAFAISFMTFFFLKDQTLFKEGLLIIIPDQYVDKVKHALSSIKRLLTRYFIGILIQVSGIVLLNTLGLKFVAGLQFDHALVYGLISGVLNVIPYVGPLAGTAIGLLLGMITHIDILSGPEIGHLLLLMGIVYGFTQVVDNVVFQPVIFSNSVKAHPLEIFAVIMMSGSLVGVGGMILAIPAYTIIRVFAKEFFNNFKVVKRLTEHI